MKINISIFKKYVAQVYCWNEKTMPYCCIFVIYMYHATESFYIDIDTIQFSVFLPIYVSLIYLLFKVQSMFYH